MYHPNVSTFECKKKMGGGTNNYSAIDDSWETRMYNYYSPMDREY